MRRINNDKKAWIRRSIHVIIILTLLVLFLYAPVIDLLTETLYSLFTGKGSVLHIIPLGRRWDVFYSTLLLALSVSISGMVLSVLIASFLLRFNKGKWKYLRWFILIFAAIPPFIHSLAWSHTVFRLNTFLEDQGLFQIPFEGLAASWWVQLMSFLPFAAGISLLGLTSIDKGIMEASRILRSDSSTFFNLCLPLSFPLILTGGVILFLLSIIDYSIPSLYQLNVYSLEIFAEFSTSADASASLLLSLPLIVLSLAILGLAVSGVKRSIRAHKRDHEYYSGSYAFPSWYQVLQWTALFIIILQIIIPLFSLVGQVESWNDLTFSFTSNIKEAGFSFLLAALTALLAVCSSWIFCEYTRKTNSMLIFWILIIPFVVPPTLTGIGLIGFWNSRLFDLVYDSSFMLVLAGLARYLPFSILIMLVYFSRINQDLLDSARLIQRNKIQYVFRIKLPLLLPGAISTFLITLILTLGELGTTLMVTPPGTDTLTLRIYNYLHYGESSTVASLCLFILLGILLLGTITFLLVIQDIKRRRNA